MTRFLFLSALVFVLCVLSPKSKSEMQETPETINYALLDEGLFNLTLAGLGSVDYSKVREDLLAMQPAVLSYQKQQQAFYWYNLALASKSLSLSSEHVIAPIKQALALVSFVNPQQHFKILTISIDLFFAYQQYELVVQSIEQLRELTKNELDPNTKRLPVIYENLKAWAYFQLGRLNEAEISLSQLIEDAEKNGTETDINWYRLLASVYQQQGDITKQVDTMLKEYAFRPSNNLQSHITFLQKSETYNSNN